MQDVGSTGAEEVRMGYFPEHPQDAKGVKRILTLDWLSRKQQRWPLVPFSAIAENYTTKSKKPSTSDPNCLCIYKSPSVMRPQLVSCSAVTSSLLSTFPALKVILGRYRGKVAVCGGILCRAAHGTTPLSTHDCDLFFYGCESATPEALNDYRAILEDCVATIAATARGRVVVDRTEHVINVVEYVQGGQYTSTYEYQLILRVYPRLDMILGGFDIGGCMIAFDGENVYTTQLGAWSFGKKAIIVDTTRRSTSYEHRLQKYSYTFDVIFPGLDDSNIQNHYLDTDAIEGALEKAGFKYIGEAISKDFVPLKVTRTTSLNGHFIIKSYGDKVVKLLSAKPRLTKEEKLLPRNLSRYSDYSIFKPSLRFFEPDYDDLTRKIYLSILKNNHRNKLFVCSELPIDHQAAKAIFASMIDNPQVQISEETLKKHGDTMRSFLLENPQVNSKHYCKMFAEFYPDLQEFRRRPSSKLEDISQFQEFYSGVCTILVQRVRERCNSWREDFKGLKWITKNPGTQHTASVNPIMEDPRKFYVNCYRPFTVGIPPEVEQCIWSVFGDVHHFPPEVVKLIIKEVVYSTHIFYESPKSLKRKQEPKETKRKKTKY
eukprot:TRINITY_DN4268_c0_g1_i4.p1 TRINITY_DN4268_c0_g1~~TRINITY_DN4268_c0_g1_i4.p1  ORF type:complete len:601 (+),score=95.82 TRINITY_DN4268_c0_g1_i4:189-1991(+)